MPAFQQLNTNKSRLSKKSLDVSIEAFKKVNIQDIATDTSTSRAIPDTNTKQEDSVETYLGNRGYCVYKKSLSPEQTRLIREKLMAKPKVASGMVNPASVPVFPIFMESANKFYIPRFFGIQHFGLPKEVKISMGADIDIEFNGDVRDYQHIIINSYLSAIGFKPRNNSADESSSVSGANSALIEVGCGRGKTVMGLKIISIIKKKTIIIVHKEFLKNQWVERIGQFLPTARVGSIQGQTIDVDDKDIVIAMLQSLSQKDYPVELFQQFGLLIIDETHHLSSECFSRALQKIITPYGLGLSATMERKDGLTWVFKSFLGEIAYREDRVKEDDVLVKAIQYRVDDAEHNEVEQDYRGNVKYSTMITKLCQYNHRSEFIITVIETEFQVNPEQQMILLSHNKSLLTYIFKAVEHRKITSVGYYVGGMKEHDLKKSETKRLILATYAMAAEALDIKSLTTLILATPKTDIVQASGRILREKHEQPLIIDIVDEHDVFQGQFQKRKRYYYDNNYRIITTSSEQYSAYAYAKTKAKNTNTKDLDNSLWQPLVKSVRRSRNSKNVNLNANTIDLSAPKCLINPFLLATAL